MSETDSSRADARETLLRALDSLDDVAEDFGEAKQTYLVVCWAHQIEGQTVRGWNSSDHPDFVTVALLREIADWIEAGPAKDATEEEENE